MSQSKIIERLYYVPKTKAVDLTVLLDLSQQSITNALRRLKKQKYVIMNDKFEYELTNRGKEFAEVYLL